MIITMKKITQAIAGAIILYVAYLLFKNIDFFELYLFNIIPQISFNTTAVFTRIVIGFIGTIGISNLFLITNRKFNKTAIIILFVLFCLSFISSISKHYIICNCFSYKILNFNFNTSIVFLLVGIFLFVNSNKVQLLSKFHKYILPAIFVILLSIVTILSAPDFFLFKTPIKLNKTINYSSISTTSADTLKDLLTVNNKKLIAFVDPECIFCQKSLIKLSIMARKHNFSNEIYLFETDGGDKIDEIFTKYHLPKMSSQYFFLNDVAILNKGKFPYIILAEGENINYEFEYRNLDEKIIKQFFKN